MSKQKVLNFFAGPGAGKSTTAAGVFASLKNKGINCEYVQEFVKDVAWDFHGAAEIPSNFLAQEFLFLNQHQRMKRLTGKVDLIITDSPLIMSINYIPADYELPSLKSMIQEASGLFNNFNTFLERANRPYNPSGRFQTEEQAKEKDKEIFLNMNRIHHCCFGGEFEEFVSEDNTTFWEWMRYG